MNFDSLAETSFSEMRFSEVKDPRSNFENTDLSNLDAPISKDIQEPEKEGVLSIELPEELKTADDTTRLQYCHERINNTIAETPILLYELNHYLSVDKTAILLSGEVPDGCTWEYNSSDNTMELYQDIDNTFEQLEQTIDDYFDDLRTKSNFPETLQHNTFDALDLEKMSPEDVALKREEFAALKPDLKQEWERANGQSWPKYETDIYSESGKLIRKAGSDYDAHHIQPLCMGGKNEAGNITPLHADVHYDKQGIHSPDSPYSQLSKLLEEKREKD